jgi:pyrroloquinoline quinone (PQQ) biosynthesis protein C
MLDSGTDSPLRIIVGENHYDLSEIAGDRKRFLRIKCRLDGRHTIQEIAAITGEEPSDIIELIHQFAALKLLRNETSTALVPVEKFRPRLLATLRMWRRQIGYHELFQSLTLGAARKEVLLGLFIETFHNLRLGPRHMACAIAATNCHRLRNELSKYLADEYSHSPLLLQTCVNLGCKKEEVEAAHPIVATLSLVQMLCEIARSDTLAYMAALALIEAEPEDGAEAQKSIASIAAAYEIDVHAFAPAVRHLSVDIAAGHASLLDVALADVKEIESERLHRIVNMLHDLKHAYDQLHDGILQYYSDISNYIPRLQVDYFSL